MVYSKFTKMKQVLFCCVLFRLVVVALGYIDPNSTLCNSDHCSNCPKETCEPNTEILVEGAGYCGCCPGCVSPKPGDNCYISDINGESNCGELLTCCNGKCAKPCSPLDILLTVFPWVGPCRPCRPLSN